MIIKNFRYHKIKHGEYDFNCTYAERKHRINMMIINNTDRTLRFHYRNSHTEDMVVIKLDRYFTKEFESRPRSTMLFKLPKATNSSWTLHCRTLDSFTRRKIVGVYAQPMHHPSLEEDHEMIKMYILLNKVAKEMKPKIAFDVNDVDSRIITEHDKKMIRTYLKNNNPV
ncbi:hypothetical protein K450DRAFT_237652 [Umbelopsis ramanniana AG]|uniref:Uncharacterized protein n=1 Tax=Umbelopsis ramanniana AG TaxID=1314678 RepID=A0AAD5EC78_UMBRA|nr:uncharacterized protein K450DRAFT_237652 [Umbelopsis ramanniana AG]KAI8580265.1 hypothetical protein K450DRAFT_237652 [Umbelopsis ramanniana AG]